MTASSQPISPGNPLLVIEPNAEPNAIAARLSEWRRHYPTTDAYLDWIVQRIVIASVRLDRVVAHESSVRAYESVRARTSWDQDRRLAAEDLGVRLAKDPVRVRRRLEETLQGADWLIERWEALSRLALAHPETGWTDPQRALALDLLAIPLEFRDALAPFDPPHSGQSPGLAQAETATAERDRLIRLRERILIARDARERDLAAQGITMTLSPSALFLHREETFWTREFHRAIAEFRRHSRALSETQAFAPATTAALDLSHVADFERKMTLQTLPTSPPPASRPEATPPPPAEHVSPLPGPTSSPPPPPGNRRARLARRARLRAAS